MSFFSCLVTEFASIYYKVSPFVRYPKYVRPETIALAMTRDLKVSYRTLGYASVSNKTYRLK